MPIRLNGPKEEARRSLRPGHPGREALLLASDEIPEAEFEVLLPTWIRLLRMRSSVTDGPS